MESNAWLASLSRDREERQLKRTRPDAAAEPTRVGTSQAAPAEADASPGTIPTPSPFHPSPKKGRSPPVGAEVIDLEDSDDERDGGRPPSASPQLLADAALAARLQGAPLQPLAKPELCEP